MSDMLTVSVPRNREFAISYLRACLRDGHVFPSAAMMWLAEALERAHEDLLERALSGSDDAAQHAPLVAAAARHTRELAKRQRERDDAHYAEEP